MYVIPELRGKGYCEQLFGYAAHEMRYAQFESLAIAQACSNEEQHVIERFVFERMKGHPEYMQLELYCPQYPCHTLA